MHLEDKFYGLLGTYMRAPQWVKHIVGGVYRRVPLRLRYGVAYERFQRQLRDVEPSEIEKERLSKLDETMLHATRTVPAYRHLEGMWSSDGGPEERLRLFPLVSKAQIKDALGHFVSVKSTSNALLPMHTGGSTAEPMRFYLGRGVTRPREAAYIADFQTRIGGIGQDMVLSMRGRSVVGVDRDDRYWMLEPIKNQLILSSDHLEPQWMHHYTNALRHFKPRVVEAFPSSLYPLARWLEEHPLPEFTERVRGVLLYSEIVLDHQMELFRRVFPCPILKHYGHSERVLMAASKPGDDNYHFWPLYGHFELLDLNGNPVSQPGEMGEIVGTSFDNQVMPFIRYRTGDYAVLEKARNSSGYPVCRSIEGRWQEFIVCRDNRLISITTLGAAHFESLAMARDIQFEQSEPGLLVLKIVIEGPLTDQLQRAVKNAVEDKTQGGCTLEVIKVEAIPKLASRKKQMILQHVDLSRYFGIST